MLEGRGASAMGYYRWAVLLWLLLAMPGAPSAQSLSFSSTFRASVVNMMPNSHSDESELGMDAQPYIAVNPANSQQLAVGLPMANPSGAPPAPLLISTDGGANWRF